MSTTVSPSMEELVSADITMDEVSSADGTQVAQLAISSGCMHIYMPTVTKL